MAASAAAPSAAAARAPSAASWTRPLRRPPAPVVRRPPPPLNELPLAPLWGAIPLSRPPFYRHSEPAIGNRGRSSAGDLHHAGRRTGHRIPQSRPAARARRHQPILAALPAVGQLGLSCTGQEMAPGIDRGN